MTCSPASLLLQLLPRAVVSDVSLGALSREEELASDRRIDVCPHHSVVWAGDLALLTTRRRRARVRAACVGCSEAQNGE
jgi:hypothetical protein